MNHGRKGHRPDEAAHQRRCLARYICKLPDFTRTRFVLALTRRHGRAYVDELRKAL